MSTRKHPHRIHRRSPPRPIAPAVAAKSERRRRKVLSNTSSRGLVFDPEIDPYYLAARAFDPTAQPWLDPEPLARVDGTNAHLACADNPIHRVEPAGGSVADEDGC